MAMLVAQQAVQSETELAKAGHALRRAIQLREAQKKPYPDARYNYAVVCRLRLDFQQSYEQFKKAAEEDPGLSQALKNASELEQLISSAVGRIGSRPLELCVFQDAAKGCRGLALGKNAF